MANFILHHIEHVFDSETVRAIILADDTPDSLTIDCSDVERLESFQKLAQGSVIIAPDGDYIAFAAPAVNGKTTFIKKNSSGGSGGGDFSTANVTFNTKAAPSQVSVSLNFAYINEEMNAVCPMLDSISGGKEESFLVPLYRGKQFIDAYGYQFALSGDVEAVTDEYDEVIGYIVMGDCTFTLHSN